MKRSCLTNFFAAAAVLSAVLIAAYLLVSARTDTYLGRWLAWKWSDIEDYQRFPSQTVTKAPPVYQFAVSTEGLQFDSIAYSYQGRPQTANLDSLLESSGTTAFIVIQDDTILYENYFNGYRRESINTSFSVAKSITALLVGIAIDEGFINSTSDPVTDYLPELLPVDPGYSQVTIGHLLAMKSGITFRDSDLPWDDKPRVYYHPNLREVVLNRGLSAVPGQAFAYNSFNPVVLGIILERSTGQPVAQFFAERLWQRLGMEFNASWSLDSDESGMAKMESGINARAIDFAKLGRLVLNQGVWNGDQVISSDWVEASTRVDPQSRVPEIGENIYYQYGWWIHAPDGTQAYAVAGWGHLGQYLYIFPDDDVIILRFGKQIGKVDSWAAIFHDIVFKLRQIQPSAGGAIIP